jgi:hypothetical protein
MPDNSSDPRAQIQVPTTRRDRKTLECNEAFYTSAGNPPI